MTQDSNARLEYPDWFKIERRNHVAFKKFHVVSSVPRFASPSSSRAWGYSHGHNADANAFVGRLPELHQGAKGICYKFLWNAARAGEADENEERERTSLAWSGKKDEVRSPAARSKGVWHISSGLLRSSLAEVSRGDCQNWCEGRGLNNDKIKRT